MQILPRGDSDTGYVYDWVRQKQKHNLENLKKSVKIQNKVKKLTKKNKVLKRK